MQRPIRPANRFTITDKGVSYDALSRNQSEWREYDRQLSKFTSWFKVNAQSEAIRLADNLTAKVMCQPVAPKLDAEPITWFIYDIKRDAKQIHDRALAIIENRNNPKNFMGGPEVIDSHDRWYGQGNGRRSGD